MPGMPPPPPGGPPPGPPPGAVVPADNAASPPVSVPGAQNGTAPLDMGDESLTLYVNNLNDKIHPDTLAKNLREVFGAFGEIQDLIAMKSLRRRGQAWIVYKELSSSSAAVKALQGFPFYSKPIRIAYAKAKSDVVSKADGTYQPRPNLPDNTVPSKTLFVENLPAGTADQSLRMLF